MVKIALDMMGGDNCPVCNLEGAFDALQQDGEIELLLVGPEDTVAAGIADWPDELKERVTIVHASEVITTEEAPVAAVRKKKDSSLSVGARLVREGEASALISAGSSGAVLAAGQLIVGRIRGVLRPPLASMFPTARGFRLFLDMGANVDAKPEWLAQFARMGTIYMQKVQHINDPEVRLVNLGVEEEKGSALVKETHALLKETEGINYCGFIETRDVIMGISDIMLTDAFTGNAILKTVESTVKYTLSVVKDVIMSSPVTKLAGAAIKKPLKEEMKRFDPSEHGGAMLLGLNGLVMKCHGNATRGDIMHAILKSAEFAREDVTGVMREAFSRETERDQGNTEL